MHNYYLNKSLMNFFHFYICSINSKLNSNYYKNNGIQYDSIIPPDWLIRFANLSPGFIKNIIRSISDKLISNLFEKKLLNKTCLNEFMDIHSEGYSFLKNNPGKRKTSIIRSHTPFGLLRKYFTDSELNGLDTWFAFSREKKCFEWAGSITTPSNDLKEQLIDLYQIDPKKVNVIPNMLDTNHFRPLLKPKSDQFTILHVGRFERAKGVETLVKAFIELSKTIKNIKLINIGVPRGPSLRKCMNWLENEDLFYNVEFTGFVQYEELPIHYANADVVVVPSEIYESFSYTVAQGMACGKPVIASNIGGIPETVNHGEAGLLFSPGNVYDLSDKIEILYKNKEIRRIIGKKARLFCETNFSMEVLKPRYLEYYRSLLN